MNKLLIASVLSGLVFAGSANAQVTANFAATAEVNSTCVITAQNLSFGTINFLAQNAYVADSSIDVLCSKNVTYSIKATPVQVIGSGNWGMIGASESPDYLNYVLSHHTGGSFYSPFAAVDIQGTGTGVIVSHGIRANLSGNDAHWSLPNQNRQAKPDNYAGTVVATITY